MYVQQYFIGMLEIKLIKVIQGSRRVSDYVMLFQGLKHVITMQFHLPFSQG